MLEYREIQRGHHHERVISAGRLYTYRPTGLSLVVCRIAYGGFGRAYGRSLLLPAEDLITPGSGTRGFASEAPCHPEVDEQPTQMLQRQSCAQRGPRHMRDVTTRTNCTLGSGAYCVRCATVRWSLGVRGANRPKGRPRRARQTRDDRLRRAPRTALRAHSKKSYLCAVIHKMLIKILQ